MYDIEAAARGASVPRNEHDHPEESTSGGYIPETRIQAAARFWDTLLERVGALKLFGFPLKDWFGPESSR